MKTSSTITTTEATALAQIIALHNEIIQAARTTLDKAIQLGGLLAQEKERLGHGNWLPWLKANVPFAERTARNYMRCHEQRDKLKSASVADLGEAYLLLAGPGALELQYEQEAIEFADELAFVRSTCTGNHPVYPEHVFPDSFAAPAEIADLPVSEIQIDPWINARAERDIHWTKWLARIPDLTPPIAVFRIGGSLFLADGRYRLDAAKTTSATHIRARIYAGTKQDALKYFCVANAGKCNSGSPYTAPDWKRAEQLTATYGRDA